MTKASSEDFAQLRRYFDGAESFMTGSQIRKRRQGTHAIPPWTMSNAAVAEVLLRSFPHLHERTRLGSRQRLRALRWTQVINLYFRMNRTRSQVLKEMRTRWPGLTLKIINHVIEDIVNVGKGLSANGGVRRPRGRKPSNRGLANPPNSN
jgi:hypothetical protein